MRATDLDKHETEMITADFYPTIPRSEIVQKSRYQFSIKDLTALGGGFAVIAATIAKAAMDAPSSEGLYRCVFPEGVAGHLATFKDGSGYLGTILNEGKFAGQARWIPVEGGSAAVGIDLVTLAVAVAIMVITRKLDQIQKTQTEILQFLRQDKESDIRGAVNSLADILEQYRFHSDNPFWKSGKLTAVTQYKGLAESNIIFYRQELSNALSQQKMVHGYQAADKLKSRLDDSFRFYQLSVYLHSYASFLEVVLSGNTSKDYLDHISEKIRNYAFQYRKDYTVCYDQLQNYMKNSVQAAALGGIGKASKSAGETIGKIPLICKGPIDEALVATGNTIQHIASKHGKLAMRDFRDNRDAGIRLFLNSIDAINEVRNQPVELLFDRENIYICA